MPDIRAATEKLDIFWYVIFHEIHKLYIDKFSINCRIEKDAFPLSRLRFFDVTYGWSSSIRIYREPTQSLQTYPPTVMFHIYRHITVILWKFNEKLFFSHAGAYWSTGIPGISRWVPFDHLYWAPYISAKYDLCVNNEQKKKNRSLTIFQSGESLFIISR